MKSDEWRSKANNCPRVEKGDQSHNWIPIAYQLSDKAKHVTTMMCQRCFHEINIADAFEHRIKL